MNKINEEIETSHETSKEIFSPPANRRKSAVRVTGARERSFSIRTTTESYDPANTNYDTIDEDFCAVQGPAAQTDGTLGVNSREYGSSLDHPYGSSGLVTAAVAMQDQPMAPLETGGGPISHTHPCPNNRACPQQRPWDFTDRNPPSPPHYPQ